VKVRGITPLTMASGVSNVQYFTANIPTEIFTESSLAFHGVDSN
jgi:hypothetical protein